MKPRRNTQFTVISRQGFSLIEMLLVVAILAILVTMLTPSTGRMLAAAKGSTCLVHARNLTMGHITLAVDNEGVMLSVHDYLPRPNGAPDSLLLKEGLAALDQFMCPLDNGKRREAPYPWGASNPISPSNFSYTRNVYLDLRYGGDLDKISSPSKTALLLEEYELAPMNDAYIFANGWDLLTQRHRAKACIGFLDGHSEFINSQQYNQAPGAWRITTYLDPN